MLMPINWQNPYAERKGNWYKGNLHTHTSPASRCGKISAEESMQCYSRAGYDFLSFSDHMTITRPAPAHNLVLIPGLEWNATEEPSRGKCHTGLIALQSELLSPAISIAGQEELLQAFAEKDVLVILNHPNWQPTPHYRREQLADKKFFHGIEIFNGVIGRLTGDSRATDKWDYLLDKGTRVLGFASDDSHLATDIGLASIIVRAAERSAESILASIGRGNFYGSSGVPIDDIRREGDILEIRASQAQEIHAVANGGRIFNRTRETQLRIDLSMLEKITYVRFEVYGQGSSMAWTQPFFLHAPPKQEKV